MNYQGLLQATVIGSFMIAFVSLLKKNHFLTSKARMACWSLVILRLLIIWSLPSLVVIPLNSSFIRIPNSIGMLSHEFDLSEREQTVLHAADEQTTDDSLISSKQESNTPLLLVSIWAIGVVVTSFCIGGIFLIHGFKARRATILPLQIDKHLKEKYQIQRNAKIVTNDVSSPYTYGIFKPVIVLPRNYDQLPQEELDLILLHEWCHIKNGDVLRKNLFLLAIILNWYNPIVYLGYRLFKEDVELSCDDEVLRFQETDKRSDYAMTLVHMQQHSNSMISGNSFSSYPLKRRIENIMENSRKEKKRGLSILCVAGILCICFVLSMVGCTNTSPSSQQESHYHVEDLENMYGINWSSLLWQNQEEVEKQLTEKSVSYHTIDDTKIQIDSPIYIDESEFIMVLHIDPEYSIFSGYSFEAQMNGESSIETSLELMKKLTQEAQAKYGDSLKNQGPDNKYLDSEDPILELKSAGSLYERWAIKTVDNYYLTISDSLTDDGNSIISLLFQITLIYQ